MGGGILVWPRASGPRKLSGCLTRFVRGGLLKIDMKMRQITHYHETDRAPSVERKCRAPTLQLVCCGAIRQSIRQNSDRAESPTE